MRCGAVENSRGGSGDLPRWRSGLGLPPTSSSCTCVPTSVTRPLGIHQLHQKTLPPMPEKNTDGSKDLLLTLIKVLHNLRAGQVNFCLSQEAFPGSATAVIERVFAERFVFGCAE